MGIFIDLPLRLGEFSDEFWFKRDFYYLEGAAQTLCRIS